MKSCPPKASELLRSSLRCYQNSHGYFVFSSLSRSLISVLSPNRLKLAFPLLVRYSIHRSVRWVITCARVDKVIHVSHMLPKIPLLLRGYLYHILEMQFFCLQTIDSPNRSSLLIPSLMDHPLISCKYKPNRIFFLFFGDGSVMITLLLLADFVSFFYFLSLIEYLNCDMGLYIWLN